MAPTEQAMFEQNIHVLLELVSYLTAHVYLVNTKGLSGHSLSPTCTYWFSCSMTDEIETLVF